MLAYWKKKTKNKKPYQSALGCFKLDEQNDFFSFFFSNEQKTAERLCTNVMRLQSGKSHLDLCLVVNKPLPYEVVSDIRQT